MDNLPLSSVSSENSSSPQSEQLSEPLFKMDNSTIVSSVPSKRKRNINSSSSRHVKWKLTDLSSHGYSESTLREMLLMPHSFTLPQVQHSKVADLSSINRHSESTSKEYVLIPLHLLFPSILTSLIGIIHWLHLLQFLMNLLENRWKKLLRHSTSTRPPYPQPLKPLTFLDYTYIRHRTA